MSIRVLLRDYPHRAVALVTETHALIFRHSSSTQDSIIHGSLTSAHSGQSRTSLDGVSPARCMVEFSELDSIDLSDYRTFNPRPVHGTLGLIAIGHDVFICVVTGASVVASVRPGETVQKIHGVQFFCLNTTDYDEIITDDIDPYPKNSQGEDSYTYGQTLSRRDSMAEHPCLEIQKLLSNGTFYYSTDFDLTNRLQARTVDPASFDIDSLDESFLWNQYMIGPLVQFRSRLAAQQREALDASKLLTSVIRGFVSTVTIPRDGAPCSKSRVGPPSDLTLISRLSCKRAGTRFNSRGIDDDGNVANFVESETIYWSPSGLIFSYVQIRGSVPVFWEQQPGLIPNQQKITVTRSTEGTQPAFNKHFEDLEQNYSAVHIVNLLNKDKPGEVELTQRYRYGIEHFSHNRTGERHAKDHQMLKETAFDFHAETKGPRGYEQASMVRHLIESSADGFAYYLAEQAAHLPQASKEKAVTNNRSVVILQQEGVFRTNCLDCLDRTNLIQTIISQMALESFLQHRGERAPDDFWQRHSMLWADNGDALSKIYAGTGALKSSFTRSGKMSFAGALADVRKSAARLYINNFTDKDRQNTMDVLLGRLVGMTPVHLHDPINDHVTSELQKRSSEYLSTAVIKIWAGTFNLNGRTEGIDEDLSSWLCPNIDPFQQHPEIVAVAFQEIVELSPQQIMNSDPTRRQAWEKAVGRTLNRHTRAAGSEDYVLLRSGQLVGAALCIFVKGSALHNIKNVEGSVKKTGMSGMAGNKGAVAIRMEYANTSICFVTAHLAAGFANYEERNRDYQTINQGLRFQRNRGIDDHDTILFLGDFNYRIGLGYENVKKLIQMGDLERLYENDQLNLQMVAGLTFPHYSEARITFMPTYKFDLGTDVYDSSEKQRIPAWTDRILRRGANIRQTNYNSAPLKFSDHRPVWATFLCTISIIDEAARDALSDEIYHRCKAEVGSTTANTRDNDTDDEDVIGYESIAPGLPPASSSSRKWWLDNGAPARSNIQPPQNGAIPNPKRPVNPFSVTDEPDWISVSPPYGSSTSTTSSGTSYQSAASGPLSRPPRPYTSVPPGPAQTKPRSLPPPFNPDQSVSSLPGNFSRISLQNESTVSLGRDSHPRTNPNLNSNANVVDDTQARVVRQSPSVISSRSEVARKPVPPPVAKKPAHLSSPPGTPGLASGLATGTTTPAPGLPPRRVDLLGGGVEEGALGEWEALKPN